jgi:2-polyprenyl-3-methyl-5-hydroxy-6-metoxy-1,4-benzoquinol methylase
LWQITASHDGYSEGFITQKRALADTAPLVNNKEHSAVFSLAGIKYLLTHPHQLKWVITREIHFGKRKKSKCKWVEWQKYDANMHIMMMKEHVELLSVNTLNVERIKIFEEMVSGIGKDLKILDVGCGDAVISEPLMKKGHFVAAVDLPTVATSAHKCNVSSIMAGDAETLAFSDASFDLVIASEVLEHLWAPESFIDEAYRILKPIGFLIIETPEGMAGLNYDSHRNFYTVEKIEKLLAPKFRLMRVERLAATGSAQTPTIIVFLEKTA